MEVGSWGGGWILWFVAVGVSMDRPESVEVSEEMDVDRRRDVERESRFPSVLSFSMAASVNWRVELLITSLASQLHMTSAGRDGEALNVASGE